MLGVGRLLVFLLFFHWVDIFFTYLLIEKYRSKYKNPEVAELNFHRHFIERFGMKKGFVFSGMLSSVALLVIGYLAYHFYGYTFLTFVLGFQFGVAYVNFVSWYRFDVIQKKLIRK